MNSGDGSGGKGGKGGGSSGDIKFEDRFPCQFCGQANDSGLDGEVCFSKDMTVQLEGEKVVKMSDLTVGDKVLTATGTYETVYAFGHYDATQEATFLQLHTTRSFGGKHNNNNNNNNNNNKPLELTSEHMVFVHGSKQPVRAGNLKVGDILQSQQAEYVIRKIQTVQRAGVYAPLTTGGTLVVNGIAASSYIAIQDDSNSNGNVVLQGAKIQIPLLSHQTTVHMLLAPFRLGCGLFRGIGIGMCNPESAASALVYNSHGIPYYVSIGIGLRQLFKNNNHPNNHGTEDIASSNMWIQVIVVVVALLLTGPIRSLEYAGEMAAQMDAISVTLVAAIMATAAAVWTARRQGKSNERQKISMTHSNRKFP